MASPAEIAKGLPETLPEDFGDWDSEPSPATVPHDPVGIDTARGLGDVSKPPAPAPAPDVIPVDRLRGAALPSPAKARADDGAFLQRPASITPKAARSIHSVTHNEEIACSAHELPSPPQRPNVPVSDGLNNLMGIATAAAPSPDEFLLSLRSNIAQTREKKHSNKKWVMVTAVSACLVLILVILAIRQFVPATGSTVKKSAQTGPAVAEAQLTNNIPKPSPSTPLIQDQLPASTQAQSTADGQPKEVEQENTPPQVQSNTMNDQLNAPARIPRDIKNSAAENEPPSVGLGMAGTGNLGGSGAIPNVFNGAARPIVRAAPSNPVTISAGVAVGLLVQKTTPLYPSIAKAARVSGTVEIQATISKNGSIKDMRVVNGPVMLRQAALDAVRSWRYKPYKLNNEPTEVQTTINVIFTLGG